MDGQVGKGGATSGTQGVTEGKKRGRNVHQERESKGEEAVHACSVTAHDLYKGMGNLYMTSRNFESWEYSIFLLLSVQSVFAFLCVSVSLCVHCVK